MPDIHHSSVHFSGHVQGVGFRFSALDVAKEFEVAGYVCNLTDGRVHLEVEGRKPDVDAFMIAIHERMHGYIRKSERTDSVRTPTFSGFVIR